MEEYEVKQRNILCSISSQRSINRIKMATSIGFSHDMSSSE